MPRERRFLRMGAAAGATVLLASLASCADAGDAADENGDAEFPNGTVTIVVGSGPGSGFDFMARGLSPRLQELWGEDVIVENVPGANQTTAYQEVADADPDGHTILIGIHNTFAISDLQGTLDTPYLDMEWFGTVSTYPWTFFANRDGDIQTFDDLLAEDPIRFGDGGFESPVTPVALSLFDALDEEFVYTPGYDPGETQNAVLSGEQNFVGREAAQFQRYGQEDEFVPIVIASQDGHPQEDEGATLADIEEQYNVEIPERPMFDLDMGMATTPGTPEETVDFMADSIVTLIEEDEEFQEWMVDNLFEEGLTVDNIGREADRARAEALVEDFEDFGVDDLEDRLS